MHALIIDRQIDANNRRRVKTLQRAFTYHAHASTATTPTSPTTTTRTISGSPVLPTDAGDVLIAWAGGRHTANATTFTVSDDDAGTWTPIGATLRCDY